MKTAIVLIKFLIFRIWINGDMTIDITVPQPNISIEYPRLV
jgi:hypothetical protein